MKKYTVEIPYQITVVATVIAEDEDEARFIAESDISSAEYCGDTVGAESNNDNVTIENVIAGDIIGNAEITNSEEYNDEE